MSLSRVVTVRLPDEQVADLETIAKFDGVAMAELLRAGVELLLEERRNDPEFRVRVEKVYADAQTMLAGVPGAERMHQVVSRPFPEQPGEPGESLARRAGRVALESAKKSPAKG